MSQAEGWYRDPFHRGQERYWDGRVWTQGTRAVEDEFAGAPGGPGDQAAEQPDLGSPATASVAPATMPPSVEPASASASEPSFAPLGAPVQPVAAVPAPGTWPPPTMGAPGPQHAKRDRRGRNVMFGVAAAALLLVAGGVSTAVLMGGSGNASAQEAVANAAAQTIDAQSADMSMSIDANVMGLHETITADGAFNFAQKTGTMSITIPVNGQNYTEQEIIDGTTVYMNIGGLGTGLTPSKPWVSMDAGQIESASGGFGSLDPTSILTRLQSLGGTVTSVGSTTHDGTAVTEYEATVPASAIMGEIGKLPSSLQQGTSGLHLPDMKMDIYVLQNGLLQAMAVPSFTFSDAGQTLSMDMTVNVSNYGVTVNATPPPADQVHPFSQIEGGLGNSGSTGNSGSSI